MAVTDAARHASAIEYELTELPSSRTGEDAAIHLGVAGRRQAHGVTLDP
jgi:hypothetical protein